MAANGTSPSKVEPQVYCQPRTAGTLPRGGVGELTQVSKPLLAGPAPSMEITERIRRATPQSGEVPDVECRLLEGSRDHGWEGATFHHEKPRLTWAALCRTPRARPGSEPEHCVKPCTRPFFLADPTAEAPSPASCGGEGRGPGMSQSHLR